MENNFFTRVFAYSEEAPLLFTRPYFWVFFTVVLGLYSLVYKKVPVRNTYLFLVSLFFYYKTSGLFFILLIISTVADYSIGHWIYRAKTPGRKKLFFFMSLFINLGMLSYYKYAYFFTGILNDMFGAHFKVFDVFSFMINELSGAHLDVDKIILPVGISFFTFQTISYTFDIYREKITPLNRIIDFGFYVSFFPQLVAGPIVRASEFVPQLKRPYAVNYREMGHALFLIMSGLAKKIMISDYIAVNFVDRVFAAPLTYGGLENILAVYGYSLQIYCDFSGYTDIAIGLALLMGFRLPINFNSPYKAISLRDFWHRWHISLSAWLRDYLYIPLGGSRKGKVRTQVNVMLTMLLGGLWHGANWLFVIWGGIHGLGLVLQRILSPVLPDGNKGRFYRFLTIFATFHLVTVAWIFFRARSLEKAGQMFAQIFHDFQVSLLPGFLEGYWPVLAIMLAGFVLHWLPYYLKEKARGYFIEFPLWLKVVSVFLFIFLLYQVSTSELQAFIYFQF